MRARRETAAARRRRGRRRRSRLGHGVLPFRRSSTVAPGAARPAITLSPLGSTRTTSNEGATGASRAAAAGGSAAALGREPLPDRRAGPTGLGWGRGRGIGWRRRRGRCRLGFRRHRVGARGLRSSRRPAGVRRGSGARGRIRTRSPPPQARPDPDAATAVRASREMAILIHTLNAALFGSLRRLCSKKPWRSGQSGAPGTCPCLPPALPCPAWHR